MANQLVVTESLSQRMIDAGANLIRTLDEKGVTVRAVFWFYLDGSDTWRLIIASPDVPAKGPKQIYERLQTILGEYPGGEQIDLRDISVVSPTDSLVALLRIGIKTGPNDISGIRFSRNTVSGQFIRDAYIYRLT
ncbi:MAG: hypothetical protein ACR2NX_09095 [Chthoniobacterales bacterium]